MHDTPFDRIVIPMIKSIFKFIGKLILGLIGLYVILEIVGFTFGSTKHFLITLGIIAYVYIVLFKIKDTTIRSNIIILTIMPFVYLIAGVLMMAGSFIKVFFKNLDNPILSGQKIKLRDIYYELDKLSDR